MFVHGMHSYRGRGARLQSTSTLGNFARGVMTYSVSCVCGRAVAVPGTDAGTARPCACGRTLAIPPLHVLRRQAGEAPTETPELVIRVLLQSGTLPEGDECASCGSPTEGAVVVRADCERQESRAGGWRDDA